ncbi:Interferon-induced GTP-binding protein Mx1 [Tetrabaena socialis]|uniref:Interferon-induced GTP-binding protein Mx1 n=1 Tax=Tetrabaena socialis TaxID=47790 RepID=A0A2J7ZSE0_9CHLO|nr:Interferon-induced GTP-binding protein Mx1 [Tetrabaena socialis]|eukprot:PNH03187.1 Interferon-induced GTP-binding protein Mx1 [Tetrabaena socialis]
MSDSSSDDGAPLAGTAYSRVSSRVLEVANRLRELGVDSALQLPTLVTAGDQSSGKSSVIEAIAGVALPRADGTCTRCPTEVRLRTRTPPDGGGDDGSAAEWSCVIKLRWDYDTKGHPLLETPPEEYFCTVRVKAHIAACVTAAQAALLNPTEVGKTPRGVLAFVPDLSGDKPRSPQALLALSDANRYELGFTFNKVILQIYGAEADLTIIDLPGIIHDHPQGKHVVDLVERLTRQSIAPDHCIIIMALPAGLDPETQAIRLWAREVDPSGSRSIGIITKPDMLPGDAHIAHGKLVKLVADKSAGLAGQCGCVRASPTGTEQDGHLKLGYFVVKNPGQEQLAREAEARYFAASPHWSLALAGSPALAQRLGADQLRSGLSALLVARIEAQLPAMRHSARAQLAALAADLAATPPPPGEDAAQELRALLSAAAERIDHHIHASAPSGDRSFYQACTALYRGFGERVIRSTPAFIVGRTLVSALSNTDKGMPPPPSASGAAAAGVALPGTLAVPAMPSAATEEGELNLTSYLEGGGRACVADADVPKAVEGKDSLRRDLEAARFPTRHMSLQEVRALRQRHVARELPGFCPYSAMEELVRGFKGQWAQHARTLLEDVVALAHQRAGAVVEDVFARYPKALRLVSNILAAHMEELRQAALAAVESLTAMEDAEIFILNDHYYCDSKTAFLGRLKRAFLKAAALSPQTQQAVQGLLSQLAGYGFSFKTPDALFMAQPTDADDELHMMAACLAYFKVAFKRIQDEVPMHIRSKLLHRLADRRGLEQAVMQRLKSPAAAHPASAQQQHTVARSLLAEDEGVATRRTQLRDMERRLREAVDVLDGSSAVEL